MSRVFIVRTDRGSASHITWNIPSTRVEPDDNAHVLFVAPVITAVSVSVLAPAGIMATVDTVITVGTLRNERPPAEFFDQAKVEVNFTGDHKFEGNFGSQYLEFKSTAHNALADPSVNTESMISWQRNTADS